MAAVDGTVATAVRLACGGGGRSLLGDRVTPPLDEDSQEVDDDDDDDDRLIDVLSQVQHAYRRLLQSNNYFYSPHGTITQYTREKHKKSCYRI